jgi:RimJ/RimL family protein N-acetyltransferase
LATYKTLEPAPESIETERLLLRPYQPGDGEAVLEAIAESRAELGRWLSWPEKIQSLEAAEDLCLRRRAEWIRREDLTYGIFLKNSDRFLGATGLHSPRWDDRAFEIGYFLRTSATGNGYMTEAVKALVEMGLNALAANRLDAWIEPENHASIRVAELVGFTYEGCLRNFQLGTNGKPADYNVYAIVP